MHSLLCEFNRAQCEAGKEGCSEHSAFRWLKQHRLKHAICPHQTDYCNTCKELVEEMNRQRTILQLLHTVLIVQLKHYENEELQQEVESELSVQKKIAQESP